MFLCCLTKIASHIGLSVQISNLAQEFPQLRTLRSCDFLCSSWISVAWYPIYGILARLTLKKLETAFLTFHFLYSPHSHKRIVLTRKLESKKKDLKLEARIIISMEYPLRPPLFHVNICTAPAGGSYRDTEVNEWYNESRAIEAEVNLRVLRMFPWDQENYVLAHQVHCLALLFDLYFDESYMSSDSGKTEPVHDKIKTNFF
ncbi:unnamed protein product [Rhodiola kirilowii]